jgi:hypothetical protein
VAKCAICESRPGKRYCTARGEDICTQCCAQQREVTINCPFSCSYLRDSRRHEKKELNEALMPHRDVQIDAGFIKKAEMLLMLMAAFLHKALEPVPNATDREAREALDALVAGFRNGTEVIPEGAAAAAILQRFREKMSEFIKELKDRESGPFTDQALLGVAVFMARVAYGYDNGRPNCRAYVHYLRETFEESAP